MIERAVEVTLIEEEHDTEGYITYVFNVVNEEDRNRLMTSLIMCVRFPNWEHRDLCIGETGYLRYREVIGGKDEWFDGKKLIPYKYSDLHFLKFILKKDHFQELIVD